MYKRCSATPIPIIYSGGSYGSYLSFVLSNIETQSNLHDIKYPFGKNGNSHLNISSTLHKTKNNNYVIDVCKDHSKFIKYHPKSTKDDVVSYEIDRLMNTVTHAILIYPSESDVLLSMNNAYFKIWDNWFDNILKDDVVEDIKLKHNLYSNWNIPSNTQCFNDIPTWIKREFLSYYMVPAWMDAHEWNLLSWYNNPNLHIITINMLLHNFKETITNISQYCSIKNENMHNMLHIHEKMLLFQEHINKDYICNNIITNYTNNTNCTINNLSIVDEAWIQWKLRSMDIEIKCNNLNTFPTSVDDLKKITYNV